MRFVVSLSFLAQTVFCNGPTEQPSRRNAFKQITQHHNRPKVQVTSCEYADQAIKRLKAGPGDIPELMCDGYKYVDNTFK